MEHENLNTPQNPPLQQTAVSGWRWFDAVLKFQNGNVCEYSSSTKGNLDDAKKQAENAVLGEVAEVLSIAFR